MSGFEVIKSGIFTLLQDRGRFGLTHLGVTNSGSMDEYAAFMANKLLQNSIDTNILEIVFGNIELQATTSTYIVTTGALCEFYINDEVKQNWKIYKIQKGDTVRVGKITDGQRVYLCVKNGFDIQKEFGSNSTTVKEELGGINGKQLKTNDFLPYKEYKSNLISKRLKQIYIPNYNEDILTLRVLLSYQENSFTKIQKDKFFNSVYTVTSDFNRMACKLKGEKIESSLDGIISEGITYGAIQIPKDGQPIILLKERQTIGGYPKIGSVLSIDCFKLSQRKINSKIRFEEININEAQKKLKEFYATFL